MLLDEWGIPYSIGGGWLEEPVMGTRMAAVGTRAPDFSLVCVDGSAAAPRQVSLDDYLERWLVLLFYPRDFSLV
jgi:hypothetical protein